MAGSISFNKEGGERKQALSDFSVARANAALADIDADNAQIAADLAIVDAATQVQVRDMVKRLLIGLRRNNLRQRKIIVYLKNR